LKYSEYSIVIRSSMKQFLRSLSTIATHLKASFISWSTPPLNNFSIEELPNLKGMVFNGKKNVYG